MVKKHLLFYAFILSSIIIPANTLASPERVDSSQQIAEKIINSSIPVLVDFWAEWCPACRMLDPIIDELKDEYEGRVLFVKIDVDVHRGITSYFGVRSIPSTFLIDNKNVVSSIPGVRPKEYYASQLDQLLTNREEK
ncbi:Thioredoxin [Chitinispirillum alkaliphilum]|nr:Thioredoxin [Chitinispirillum alkaliphilum]